MQINPVKTNPSPAFGCNICQASEKALKLAGVEKNMAGFIVDNVKYRASSPINTELYDGLDFCIKPESEKIKKLLNPIFDKAEEIAQKIKEGSYLDEIIDYILTKPKSKINN